MRIQRYFRCFLALIAISLVGGCTTSQNQPGMGGVYSAYQAGDFPIAYQRASALASSRGSVGREAAYMAGMSAYRMGQLDRAEHYLRFAAQETLDRKLTGDAQAGLGLVALRRGDFRAAEIALLTASENLQGEDRANASYFAAVAQQRQGKTNDARANLTLARSLTSDADLRRQIDDQLSVTGYTLQLGAFSSQANAQAMAQRVSGQINLARVGALRVVRALSADGQRLYLVQVGQYSNHASALEGRARLGSISASSIIVPMQP